MADTSQNVVSCISSTATHQSSDLSVLSVSSAVTSSSSIRDSQQPESTSAGLTNLDPKVARRLDEQEATIKTLNKQLTHYESDLQMYIDLVSTLEASLGDSEKSLRKARMHAAELARERDTLNSKVEALRNELTEAKRGQSIVQEKQPFEQRSDEERKATSGNW